MTLPTLRPDAARELRRRALGWGVAVESVGDGGLGADLVLEGGDLAVVEGEHNLAQGLRMALTTLKGSDVFVTDYGFDGLNALVNETDPLIQRERIRVAVVAVLRSDPRIDRISDVRLDEGDELLSGRPVRARELHVSAAFQTVVGDRNVVEVGRVTSG